MQLLRLDANFATEFMNEMSGSRYIGIDQSRHCVSLHTRRRHVWITNTMKAENFYGGLCSTTL